MLQIYVSALVVTLQVEAVIVMPIVLVIQGSVVVSMGIRPVHSAVKTVSVKKDRVVSQKLFLVHFLDQAQMICQTDFVKAIYQVLLVDYLLQVDCILQVDYLPVLLVDYLLHQAQEVMVKLMIYNSLQLMKDVNKLTDALYGILYRLCIVRGMERMYTVKV